MSKGSARRPSDVDAESFAERWERTFGSDGVPDVAGMRGLLRERERADAMKFLRSLSALAEVVRAEDGCDEIRATYPGAL